MSTRGSLLVVAAFGVLHAVTRLASTNQVASFALTALSALAAGYLLSYTRDVALSEAQKFPPLSHFRTHARRGLSLFVVQLPSIIVIFAFFFLGLAALMIPYERELISYSLILSINGALMTVAFTAVTLPLVAPYVLADEIAAAFKLKDNLRAAWLHRDLLGPPVILAAFVAVMNLALSRSLFAVTHAPVLVPPEKPPILLFAANPLGPDPLAGLLAVIGIGVMFGLLEVVAAHLLGQYARLLYLRRSPV